MGDKVNISLVNDGNSAIIFSEGDPFKIQIFNNGTWLDIFLGGGTQGFWSLHLEKKVGYIGYFPRVSNLMNFITNLVIMVTSVSGLGCTESNSEEQMR